MGFELILDVKHRCEIKTVLVSIMHCILYID
jgi:hypothetical protein